MVFKQTSMELETPTPFSIRNFHFVFWNTSLSHHRYHQRWCTFFHLVFIWAKRISIFAYHGHFWPIWAISSRIYALFGVLFTGLINAACQKWQISGMKICCQNHSALQLIRFEEQHRHNWSSSWISWDFVVGNLGLLIFFFIFLLGSTSRLHISLLRTIGIYLLTNTMIC